MVNLELFNIFDDIKKVSKAFVVHPKNVNAENSTILPVMLSSKLLPEMEVEDNSKREQLLLGMQNLPLSSQIEKFSKFIEHPNFRLSNFSCRRGSFSADVWLECGGENGGEGDGDGEKLYFGLPGPTLMGRDMVYSGRSDETVPLWDYRTFNHQCANVINIGVDTETGVEYNLNGPSA
ncbi:hypothetical protein SO802_022760 [Lithocarpus litseifolius]|uniref:Uncharacterized protein n=1 Tax=Lithocarpus litseifolius TaxID=425828 RepID=A0AAW2C4P3_9ROSI